MKTCRQCTHFKICRKLSDSENMRLLQKIDLVPCEDFNEEKNAKRERENKCMDEKERFINTIKKSLGGLLPLHMAERLAERVAEALIQDGAVFPGCKVGDTAYFAIYDSVEDKWHISAEPIVDVCTKGFYTSGHEDSTENGDLWEWSDVGETVFFSNEEAEKAIAERSGTDD